MNERPRRDSAPPPVKLASTKSRRAACTHITMDRFYSYGESHNWSTCHVCYLPSRLGWLYRCTQDINECYLAEDASGVPNTAEKNMEHEQKLDPGVISLTPWIEQAIEDGHYTREQVLIMRQQKQRVKEAIAEIEAHFEETLRAQYIRPSLASLIPNYPTNANQINANETNTDEMHVVPELVLGVEPPENSEISSKAITTAQPKLFPFCKFMCCQNCRPIYRDRTWQTFEDVFAQEVPLCTVDFENDNRPLADPSNMQELGSRVRKRPTLGSFESMGIIPQLDEVVTDEFVTDSSTTPLTRTTDESHDLADAEAESESKGFRDSMKRAFRGMVMRRRGSSIGDISKKSSSKSIRSGRRVRARTTAREEYEVQFDIGLWRQLNDELLWEASHTKLPGHDGLDGLENQEGEVDVENGVAVTEEAVDLGSADIIMSV